MTFCSPGEVAKAARAGAQVIHTNAVWPYFPLRRDGGGLPKDDAARLHALADACKQANIRLVLGLPPFPPVALVQKHPDWRVQPDQKPVTAVPAENNLGTRVGCNLGPWGDYLIEICAELTEDYQLDGFSFDGNYHPALCQCPACTKAYPKATARENQSRRRGLPRIPRLARRAPRRPLPPDAKAH